MNSVAAEDIVMARSLPRSLLVAACGLLLCGSVVGAQPHPDFSGTWEVERVEMPMRTQNGGRESGGRGARPGPSGTPLIGDAQQGPVRDLIFRVGDTVQIKQTPDQLIVLRERENGGVVTSYPLDGSESRTEEPDGNVSTSSTRWDGVALVTLGSRSVSNMRGDMTLTTREVRTLGENGRSMILALTIDAPRGSQATTVTFVRRGP